MKDIPKKFVKNCDLVGNNTFTQVKKDGNVYMYRRDRNDGTFKSYEVFIGKFIAKGTQLPGGAVEKEDRIQYPGSAQFGKTAYDCKTEDQADRRFEELLEKSKLQIESKNESLKTGKRVVRRNKKKVDVQLPKGKFTMKMLVAETGMTQPVLYLLVQNLIKTGKVVEVERVRVEGQRGKASVVYSVV